MKNLTVLLLSSLLFFACKNNTGNADEESSGDSQEKDKKISTRDLSVTSANAYNDLFLDTSTVAAYIDTLKASDKVKRRILSFYNSRNYQYAWFSSDGLTEQARGFWNLYHYNSKYYSDSLTKNKKLVTTMDRLFAQDDSTTSISNTDKSARQTELTLTRLFIEHGLEVYEEGYVKRKEMEHFVPIKKVDAIQLADSLVTKKHKDNKYFDDINESYKKLKVFVDRYSKIAKNGGWPTVETTEKKIKPGASSPAIVAIKNRLKISGDYGGQDTTKVYDSSLVPAIKDFQLTHGYTADGIITQALIKEMNVPVNKRLQQLLINLDRMRWMPSRPKGNLIVVNIPEFVLHVMENEKKVFDMNVVVGKDGHSTMMFTDDLNQIVFSPYWNVPSSIVKKEILPAMERNPDYLARNNMEVVKEGGEVPEIRQLPGPKNSLGKVKFLFPNSFNIYFHDTPAKSLFSKDKRAFSHGCIRLSEPERMANYLLRSDPTWTPERISEAMNSGEEKFVKIKDPVPVFITYYTAWVDEQGKLNFRDDIYKHDANVARKMFTTTDIVAR
jgi:murein L,D-transpeptidase YcbB/YkuD